MFKHRKHSNTITDVTSEPVEASLTADDGTAHYQPLRNDLGRILGVDPEMLHPDKGRRADA